MYNPKNFCKKDKELKNTKDMKIWLEIWETYLVPASFASSNFEIPFNLFVFLPVCLPFNCWSALNFEYANTESTMPHFSSCLVNLSENEHLEPNLFICKVMFSFVCESKVGLTIRQLTNNQMWFLICKRIVIMRVHFNKLKLKAKISMQDF